MVARVRTGRAEEAGGPVVHSQRPLAVETPLAALGLPVTPLESAFVRCHFDIPRIDPAIHRLVVDGAVDRPLALELAELQAGRVIERRITLECAGNGRSGMVPPPPGIPW